MNSEIFLSVLLYVCFGASVKLSSYIPDQRISGGTNTQPKQVPWVAAIIRDDGRICTGSLISNRHVLTSAYCAQNSIQLEVILGAYNISDPNENNIRFYCRDVYIHDGWNLKTLQNDIAVIRLPIIVQFKENIQPILLPNNNDINWQGFIINIAGWGETNTSIEYSKTLQYTDTRGQNKTVCEKIYPNNFNSTIHFCIGGFKDRTMCAGDEGGPATFDYVRGKTPTLIGVASFRMAQSCYSNTRETYPAVYTIVWKYRDWIKKIAQL